MFSFLLLSFIFYLPTINRSLTPFNVYVRRTYLVTWPTPNPYVPFPEGNEGGLAFRAEAQSKPQDGLLAIQ